MYDNQMMTPKIMKSVNKFGKRFVKNPFIKDSETQEYL